MPPPAGRYGAYASLVKTPPPRCRVRSIAAPFAPTSTPSSYVRPVHGGDAENDPRTGLKIGSETGLKIDSEMALKIDSGTSLQIDSGTDLNVDARTDLNIDFGAGLIADSGTGLKNNSRTGIKTGPGMGGVGGDSGTGVKFGPEIAGGFDDCVVCGRWHGDLYHCGVDGASDDGGRGESRSIGNQAEDMALCLEDCQGALRKAIQVFSAISGSDAGEPLELRGKLQETQEFIAKFSGGRF